MLTAQSRPITKRWQATAVKMAGTPGFVFPNGWKVEPELRVCSSAGLALRGICRTYTEYGYLAPRTDPRSFALLSGIFLLFIHVFLCNFLLNIN